MRNNPTAAEKKLWSVLRNRQIGGVRFNRQVPIGPYICDFAARTERLVIEVDGGQHAIEEARDESRSHFLRCQGYRVVRIWNNDVISNIEGVMITIARALDQSPSRLAGGEEGGSPEGEGLSESGSTGADMPSPTPPASGRGY